MKTIILRIEYKNKDDRKVIESHDMKYSSMVRFSFKRMLEGFGQKEIYKRCRLLHPELNSFLAKSATREGIGENATYEENKKRFYKKFPKNLEYKHHFGKYELYRRGYITLKEYKKSKMRGIFSEGEANQNGNRLFQIDLQNKEIKYRIYKNNFIHLTINECLKKKRYDLLKKIQDCMNSGHTPVSFRLKANIVFISYDETIVEKDCHIDNLMENRVLGIDLNPEYIGLSVLDFRNDDSFRVLLKEVICLKELNEFKKNKINFEIEHIIIHIMKISYHFRTKNIVIEELNELENQNGKYNKHIHFIIKHKWKYGFFRKRLQTQCNINNIRLISVNPAYSSIVGNIAFGNESTPDMVAASIEIGRRGYKKFSKNWFYPTFDKSTIQIALKDKIEPKLLNKIDTWVKLFHKIKEMKLSYRFQLDYSKAVFRKDYNKRGITILQFI